MRRRFYLIPYVFHLLIFAIFVLFWAKISESMYLAEVTTFLSLIWWLDTVTSGRMYRDTKRTA
jgi:fucose 4-O-acetylase-like acetyltransferase